MLARQNINCDFLLSVKSGKIDRNAHGSNQSRVKCNVQHQPKAEQFNHPVSSADVEAGLLAGH